MKKPDLDALEYIEQLEAKVLDLEKRCDNEHLNAVKAIRQIEHVKLNCLKQIEQIVAQMPRLITVGDCYPENEVPVLLLYTTGYAVVGYWCEDFAEWDDMMGIKIARPVWWMPIPKPPKENV